MKSEANKFLNTFVLEGKMTVILNLNLMNVQQWVRCIISLTTMSGNTWYNNNMFI